MTLSQVELDSLGPNKFQMQPMPFHVTAFDASQNSLLKDVIWCRGGISARQRAIDVFSHLRMWNTEQRNGVLVYLLYADRSVEIVADRGVHDKTGSHEWESICHSMEAAFRADKFEEGAIAGIRAIARLMALHYPGTGASRNELPNAVVLL